MKPLHLLPLHDCDQAKYKYIFVTSGFVYATNAYGLIKVPVQGVFGEGCEIQEDEKLFFPADQWKLQRFAKAVSFKREGRTFNAYDKKGILIGLINPFSLQDYSEIHGTPIDFEVVIPKDYQLAALELVSFCPATLNVIVECLGEPNGWYFEFIGQNKTFFIRNVNEEKGGYPIGFGLLFPTANASNVLDVRKRNQRTEQRKQQLLELGFEFESKYKDNWSDGISDIHQSMLEESSDERWNEFIDEQTL